MPSRLDESMFRSLPTHGDFIIRCEVRKQPSEYKRMNIIQLFYKNLTKQATLMTLSDTLI